jgi:hypothetical protein
MRKEIPKKVRTMAVKRFQVALPEEVLKGFGLQD